MKVYKVGRDVDRYQGLVLTSEQDISKYSSIFESRPLLESWVPPSVYSFHPKLLAGDFWNFWASLGTLAITPEAVKKLGFFLQINAELLPLPYDGRDFVLWNILECINCLDVEKSVWSQPGRKLGPPKKYVFHSERFTHSVFKIPESAHMEILVLERTNDPTEEFKAFVEAEGMTGLIFKEIWNSES